MFTDALEYPFKSNIVDYFIGGLIWSLGAMFILPFMLLYGYLVSVLTSTIQNKNKPPKFIDVSVKKLLINGIAYSTLAILYWFVGTIIIISILFISFMADQILIYLLSIGLIVIISFCTTYITRASVLIYADKSQFEKCFNLKLLWTVLKSKSFLVANIILFGLVVIFTTITTVLIFIPIIGWLFFLLFLFMLPLIMFYYLLFKYRYLGLKYSQIQFDN